MSSESLKTVERTLGLLKLFSRAAPEMTAAELVRRSQMPRAVVQRILVTLEQEGFVERCPDSLRYRVGLGACEVGALYLSGNPLVQISDDILRQLAQDTGYSVYLGARIGSEVTILALHEGPTTIRFLWSPGDRLPVATTALGKAMLMHYRPEKLDAVLGRGPLAGLSPHSIRTRDALDEQLHTYRPKGWIPAVEESLPGIYAVGAAILSPTGEPLAGISVSFLHNRSQDGQVEAIAGRLIEAAQALSERSRTVGAYRAKSNAEGARPRAAPGSARAPKVVHHHS